VPNDFPSDIVNEVGHRPWPMPGRAWMMRQSWHDLLFAHWPVAVDAVRTRVPRTLELDLFDGTAWVGVVPFHMTNVAPRAMPPLPWVSAFPELNVRTYVTYCGKPGVYFFSLDAANPLAVIVARTMLHLPYYRATMDVAVNGEWVEYESLRTQGGRTAHFKARYRPIGPVFQPTPGTLEHFLAERYCLYTADSIHVRRLDIHHPPWRLQSADAVIATNTVADASGIALPPVTPLLHFARRQDAVAWPPVMAS